MEQYKLEYLEMKMDYLSLKNKMQLNNLNYKLFGGKKKYY